MTPKWQKLASLALNYAHSGFSSLVQSLLPRDTLLRTYSQQNIVAYSIIQLLQGKTSSRMCVFDAKRGGGFVLLF